MASVDVKNLAQKFGFEVLPDCPAATQAGYSTADRAVAQVNLGIGQSPTAFYYSAGTALGSILIARCKLDGSLIWATNCNNYTLNNHHLNTIICRIAPRVFKKFIFIGTSDNVSNIGPEVFCIHRYTGNLIWAIAYQIPKEISDILGFQYITTPGNYNIFETASTYINKLELVITPDESSSSCCSLNISVKYWNLLIQPTYTEIQIIAGLPMLK